MKIRLVIDSEEGMKRSGPYQGFELIPSNSVAEFVDSMAESYEQAAFRLYDEIERLIKEGDIDSVVTIADQAKKLNEHYLLLNEASDILWRQLSEEEQS